MSNQPQEFEGLQALLKLKRHEAPPPGYFNNFSTQIIRQLEREARLSSRRRNSWFLKCLSFLETNPVAAGLFGVSVCGLLVLGFNFSQDRTDEQYTTNGNVALDLNNAASSASSLWNKNVRSGFVSASLDPVFGGALAGTVSSGFDHSGFEPANFSSGQ